MAPGFGPRSCLGTPLSNSPDATAGRLAAKPRYAPIGDHTIHVSEDDRRVIAEHGYEGVASTYQDPQAKAVSLFVTDMLAASIGRGNGVAMVATPFPSQSSPMPVRSTVVALPVNDDERRSGHMVAGDIPAAVWTILYQFLNHGLY